MKGVFVSTYDYRMINTRLESNHDTMTEDHVLTSANIKIFITLTRNAVNKSV